VFLVLSGPRPRSRICYFRALRSARPRRSPVDKLSVVLVALFRRPVSGEKLTLPNWLGVP